MCMNALSARMPVHHLCAVPKKSRRGIGSPGTRVGDGYEMLCGCWEPKLGPLEKTV